MGFVVVMKNWRSHREMRVMSDVFETREEAEMEMEACNCDFPVGAEILAARGEPYIDPDKVYFEVKEV